MLSFGENAYKYYFCTNNLCMNKVKSDRPGFLPVLIGTGFGSGYSPFAPGTAGAAVALLIWIILGCFLSFETLLLVTAVLVSVFMLLGVWAGNVLERYWGDDPSRVVVDEMVGVWISLLAVPAEGYVYPILAFVLFRLFDIFKPLGVRKMERFGGGLGIMMDDVLAGFYGAVVILLLRFAEMFI